MKKNHKHYTKRFYPKVGNTITSNPNSKIEEGQGDLIDNVYSSAMNFTDNKTPSAEKDIESRVDPVLDNFEMTDDWNDSEISIPAYLRKKVGDNFNSYEGELIDNQEKIKEEYPTLFSEEKIVPKIDVELNKNIKIQGFTLQNNYKEVKSSTSIVLSGLKKQIDEKTLLIPTGSVNKRVEPHLGDNMVSIDGLSIEPFIEPIADSVTPEVVEELPLEPVADSVTPKVVEESFSVESLRDVIFDNNQSLRLKNFENLLNSEQESNGLKVEIPTLTEIIDDEVTISQDSAFKTQPQKNDNVKITNIDFTVKSFHNKQSISSWGTLEISMNEQIVLKYNKINDAISCKEFWLFLYNLKSQGFFYKEYYWSWLITWLSSLDKVKIQTLRFPFIWKNIIQLDGEDVLNLIKPNLDALSDLGEMSVTFSLLESLVLADVELPQYWLEEYIDFNQAKVDLKTKKLSSFKDILLENKKMK